MDNKIKLSKSKKKYILFINLLSENDYLIVKLFIENNSNIIKVNNRKKLENQIKEYSFSSYKIELLEKDNLILNIIIIDKQTDINKKDLMDYSINTTKWKVIYHFNIINRLNDIKLVSSDSKETNINLEQIIAFLKEKKYIKDNIKN